VESIEVFQPMGVGQLVSICSPVERRWYSPQCSDTFPRQI
jgi:hypothetical protein